MCTKTQMVEQMMHLIETCSLSALLMEVADKCREDRTVLVSNGDKSLQAKKYLSEEELILSCAASMLCDREKEYDHGKQ